MRIVDIDALRDMEEMFSYDENRIHTLYGKQQYVEFNFINFRFNNKT